MFLDTDTLVKDLNQVINPRSKGLLPFAEINTFVLQ